MIRVEVSILKCARTSIALRSLDALHTTIIVAIIAKRSPALQHRNMSLYPSEASAIMVILFLGSVIIEHERICWGYDCKCTRKKKRCTIVLSKKTFEATRTNAIISKPRVVIAAAASGCLPCIAAWNMNIYSYIAAATVTIIPRVLS